MTQLVLRMVTGLFTCFLVCWPACASAPPADATDEAIRMQPGAMALGKTREGVTFVVQTGADSRNGSGTLQRRSLHWTNGAMVVGSDLAWDAGLRLTGTGGVPARPPPHERLIYTLDTWSGQPSTVPFRWEFLGAELRALYGGGMLAYLRGERHGELGHANGTFRKRTLVMGDVVNSVPLVVGPPAGPHSGDSYGAFRAAAAARPTVIYVGANDGMLHAFDADSGAELFAYVPSMIADQLADLGKPAYRRRPYVDASAGQGDVLVRGRWHSVLACGMGAGAAGLFALDITRPGQFGQGLGALWEFSDADDAGIGSVSTPPLFAVVNSDGPTGLVQRHVVIVSSGPHSTAVGPASLYLLTLDKAADEPWRIGRNYFRLTTDGDGRLPPGGLSPPALVLGTDGTALFAYAGDPHGNLWRFDLTRRTSRRVFTAVGPGSRRQPILHAPRIVYAPGGGYLVLFGTGMPRAPADRAAPLAVQSLYAIHDDPQADEAPVRSREALMARTVSGTAGDIIDGAPIDYFAAGAKRGWYLDLPGSLTQAERAAATPVVHAGSIIFETVATGPGDTAVTRVYLLEAISGLAFDPDGTARTGQQTGRSYSARSELASLIVLAPVQAGQRDPVGRRVTRRTVFTLRPEHDHEQAIPHRGVISEAAGRLAWREIANWHDLHRAATRPRTRNDDAAQ